MADKPVKVPRWNTTLANQTEPTEAKKDTGWTVGEKPIPSSFFNWLQFFAGDWLRWLDERVTNTLGTAPRIGLRGVGSTGEAGGTGGDFVGNGAAAGATGTGGATSGPGVVGTGGAPDGKGGTFTGTGAGAGSHGVGGATGYGMIAEADATSPARSALRIVPQDANPTVPLQGDVYFNSVAKKIRFYEGTKWLSIAEAFATIGDGVTTFGDFNGTDETPFLAAMAALPAGGAIIVKRGTYTFTTTLVVSTTKIRFIGEHREATVLTSSLVAAATVQVTANEVEFRDLTIRQTQGPSANFALDINGAAGTFVFNCKLIHTYAGGIADNAPYAVFRILNGQKNNVFHNFISFVPSILTGGGVDRFGVLLAAVSTSGTAAFCKQNLITSNIFDCSPSGTTTPTSHTAFVALVANNTSTGGAFCTRNTVALNRPAAGLADTIAVAFYGAYMRTSRTGTGAIEVDANLIQGNDFHGAGADSGSIADVSFRLENGTAGSIDDNIICGNAVSSAGGFSYGGAAPVANNLNSLNISSGFIGSSLNGPTTDRALVDNDMNQTSI